MKNPQQLRLIDGEFSPADAKEILMNVFLSKIQFHQMKIFSSQERYGIDDPNSKKRIAQIQKSMEKISSIIDRAEAKNERLSISSLVHIEVIKSKK